MAITSKIGPSTEPCGTSDATSIDPFRAFIILKHKDCNFTRIAYLFKIDNITYMRKPSIKQD